MKKLDVELSQEVAKEASKEINNTKKELENNKDAYISFMKDVFSDTREHTKFHKRLIIALLISNIITIFAMVGLNVYHQNALKSMADDNTQKISDFMNQFDFYSEVEIMNEFSDYNHNNLNIKK